MRCERILNTEHRTPDCKTNIKCSAKSLLRAPHSACRMPGRILSGIQMVICLVFIALVSGCGPRASVEVNPAAFPNPDPVIERETTRLRALARNLLPEALQPEDERTRYMRLRAEHTVHVMKGGSGDEYLRSRKIDPADWRRWEDTFWLDPEVRTAVSRAVWRKMNENRTPLR